jgi:hypothetical protein
MGRKFAGIHYSVLVEQRLQLGHVVEVMSNHKPQPKMNQTFALV